MATLSYDAIVLGLGGMGSAALSHLARRGARVLGIEQYPLVHHRGSSHGHTRIIRTAYAEHPAYVPLVRRAFTLWRELEARRGVRLLTPHPCLNLGRPDGPHLTGVRDSVQTHQLQAEVLTADDVNRRFPAFRIPAGFQGILEQEAGYLMVEECVRAHLNDAQSTGRSEIRSEEAVHRYIPRPGEVEVETNRGRYLAGKLVIAGGAWAGALLRGLPLPLQVLRQTSFWFEPTMPDWHAPERFPLFIVETPAGDFYGFPRIDGRGIKCAQHYGAAPVKSPSDIDWNIHDDDERPVRDFMSGYFASGIGPRTEAMVCMYTVTPDRHFVIDRHPNHPELVFAAGFSGHGFKFAPVIGEILADLVQSSATRHDIRLFHQHRFQRGTCP